MIRLIREYTGEFKKQAILAPIFVTLEVLLGVLIPYVMSLIIDVGINGENGSDMNYIYKMGAFMVVLAVLSMVFGALSGITASTASSGFVRNVRLALFEKIQSFSFANMDQFEVPSLVTRVTKDLREIRMAYISIVRQLVRTPVQLIICTIIVFSINKSLGLVFAVAIPILGVGLFLISKYAHPRFRILMSKFDGLNASLEENFIGMRVVKTFVREDFEKEKFKNSSDDVLKSQRHAESLVILNNPFFTLVMYCCLIAIYWFGGRYIMGGTMTTGEFMSYVTYTRTILFSLLGLSGSLMQIINAQASIDRICEVLDTESEITDDDNDESLVLEDGSIKFDNVSFKYSQKANRNALENINLEIKSGETIGIIGPTGSGKTSLIQLIPRLYDVTEGSVVVGGHDVRKYKLDNLRKEVAIVLQKNVLFSGSIEENLKWGNPNATHKEVVEACECAQADDFVSSFPDGYETDLGQGGVNVSGGQKQRLCIARALLKKPKIIILDDSTSAVDTDTDKRIRAALKERLSGMTTIIIAQRITSVMDSDKIIVMGDGKIEDVGTHDELLARNELYRSLYETQQQGVSE